MPSVRVRISFLIAKTMKISNKNIGSERVASALGTINNLGLLCEGIHADEELINRMNEKVIDAGENLRVIYDTFGKHLSLGQPLFYGREVEFICDNHDYTKYAPFWYHPDHLGSSSYITNLSGRVTQHMEYLPFGETLVDEHLNSHNSPFKFNAKELDAETGNYYYGARYYNPKGSIWLSVDPLFAKYPTLSPYIYTANNPVKYIDPDGQEIKISYIYQKDKEGNYVLDYLGNRIVTRMNIDITGKLINFSNNNVNMEDALTDIIEHIEESYSGNFDGLEVKTTANISIANSMEDVAESDHLFVLVEPGKNNNRASGAANYFGGMVAFIDADYFTGWFDTNFGKTGQRTASHELGHLFHLEHTGRGLMRGGGFGTSLTRRQFNAIRQYYDAGMLNQGPNYNMNGLPNEGALQGKGIFNMTNTAGRNKKVDIRQYFQRYYRN